jgi:uncharacterized membrane protein
LNNLKASMNKYLAAYGGTAVVLLALDALWLGVIAKPLYQQGIGHLMAAAPNIPVALAFYLLFPVGLLVFAVAPLTAPHSWTTTLTMAALFGFFTYATYDLSNWATLKDWPWQLSLIDIAWGSFLSAASAAGGKVALDWATRA